MSEKAPGGPNGEKLHSVESAERVKAPEQRLSKETKAHHESRKDVQEDLAHIRQEVAQEALSGKDAVIDTSSEQNAAKVAQPLINRELKQHMLDRTLVHVRKKLSVPSRQLSKVVHAKPVEAVSAVGEKTIARPVGLLVGSATALVGTAFSLYMSRHYGYKYNFLLFLLCFVAGYAVATALELIYLVIRRAKHGKRA